MGVGHAQKFAGEKSRTFFVLVLTTLHCLALGRGGVGYVPAGGGGGKGRIASFGAIILVCGSQITVLYQYEAENACLNKPDNGPITSVLLAHWC